MPTRYDEPFRRIARSLSSLELMRASDGPLDGDERALVGDKDSGRRFLDFYGDEGLRIALDRYGILPAIARRGYRDVSVVVRVRDDRHSVFLETPVDGAMVRVLELVVRRDVLVPRVPPGLPPLRERYQVLTIDWLLLRDPKARFSAERPRLPGQDHPGLGVGWRMMSMLTRVVWRLELDALVTVAEYLHNAEYYAREMPYFDPTHAGRLRALLALLREREGLTTAQASWAMHWGHVLDGKTGAPLAWRGELQLATEDPSLLAYTSSPEYTHLVQADARSFTPRLDRAAFDRRWADELPSIVGDVSRS